MISIQLIKIDSVDEDDKCKEHDTLLTSSITIESTYSHVHMNEKAIADNSSISHCSSIHNCSFVPSEAYLKSKLNQLKYHHTIDNEKSKLGLY